MELTLYNIYYIIERLSKRYNERIGTYKYVDAFTGAGMFDSIIKQTKF